MTRELRHYKRFLEAAVMAARNGGFAALTHIKIAEIMHVTRPAVFYYFPTVVKLRDAVAKRAIELKDDDIILQMIAVNHPLCASLTEQFRAQVKARYHLR